MTLFKRIAVYHLLPAAIGLFIVWIIIQKVPATDKPTNFPTSIKQINYCPSFAVDRNNSQLALAFALKTRIPVLFGSSELSAKHLEALPHNFFPQCEPKVRFLSVGHQGFQCFAMMTVLAANRSLLKNSKITIILSPGWFEEQYCKGTSLPSFFEYINPSLLYTIYKDSLLDKETLDHIKKYISYNYDKISKPDALLRLMGKKQDLAIGSLLNSPFLFFDKRDLEMQEQIDPDLLIQEIILKKTDEINPQAYIFPALKTNWDSLIQASSDKFKSLSNNNTLAVENNYYNKWLKDKALKTLVAVGEKDNQEYKDFLGLVSFLKSAGCEPSFVITPLNKKAHKDLNVLLPVINSIKAELDKNKFKYLDMYSPNAKAYQDGVMEDIMHPYNVGWYQIDKFIYENYHD